MALRSNVAVSSWGSEEPHGGVDKVGGPVSKEDVGQQAAPEKEAVLPTTKGGWISTGSHQNYDRDIQHAAVIGDTITEEDCVVHLLASLPD